MRIRVRYGFGFGLALLFSLVGLPGQVLAAEVAEVNCLQLQGTLT